MKATLGVDTEVVRGSVKNPNMGLSAYEVWLGAGNSGTVEDFLLSLKGEKGEKGEDGKDGEDGNNGLDIYNLWIAQGNTGSEADFLRSLKGADGEKGADGADGKDGTDGKDGADGEKGADGKSAYQSWLDIGNSGSEADFIASLKGEKGEDGEDAAPADIPSKVSQLENDAGYLVESDLDDVEKKVSDLEYMLVGAMEILSFTNSVKTAEKGGSVKEVVLNWSLNRAAAQLTLDGESVDVQSTAKTVTETITADRTFVLKAVDERGAADEESTKISFYNGVYSGVLAEGAVIDSAAVLTLDKKLQGTRAVTFTATADAGQHIAFALPSAYGTPVFRDVDTGFEAGFYKAETFSFVNASGYAESYDVWLSTYAGLGYMKISVT